MPETIIDARDRTLVRELYPALRRFAATVGSCDVEPDDLVQEALLRTLRTTRLSGLDNPRAYLSRAPPTTTPSLPEETTTTTTEIVDAAVANWYFVFEFDPGTDDLDDLRTALETYDASPYVLIRLVAEGGVATQRVVFEYLEQPSAWNVQTLVAMEEYGSPAGTYEDRVPWPDSVRTQIRNSLELAAFSTFGDDAELLVALEKSQLEDILRSCPETDGCEFGSAWYAIPEVVSRISVSNQA